MEGERQRRMNDWVMEGSPDTRDLTLHKGRSRGNILGLQYNLLHGALPDSFL